MSGLLYPYTPAYPQRSSPGEAFEAGFRGGQEAELRALGMDAKRQYVKLAGLQEQRQAELFPIERDTRQQALRHSVALSPLQLEQGRLTNQQLEAQIQNLRTQIGERAAAAGAVRGIAFPTLPGGAAAAPAPSAPGLNPPGSLPGILPPEAAPIPAPTVGPQSSAAPAWLNNPEQYGERRFTGTQVASAGINDATGLPTGMSPAQAGGAPVRPGPTERLPVVRPLAPTSNPRLIDAAVAELSIDPALRTPAMIQQVAGQYGIDPAVVAERLGVSMPVTIAPTAAAAPTTPGRGTEVRPPGEAPATGVPARDDRSVTSPGYRGAEAFNTNQAAAPSDPYITEPVRIGQDRTRLTRAYNRLQTEYRAAVASRDAATASRVAREAEGVVEELKYLDGMTAITRLRAGDPGPLAQEFYATSGNRMQLQPRSDGTFNIFLDGRMVNEGVTRSQIETSARTLFDTNFRAQIQQRLAQNAELAVFQAKQVIEQGARVDAEGAIEILKNNLRATQPNLDVRTLTDASGQQSIAIVDKNTGTPIRVLRVITRPPVGNARTPQVTLE
jgi:hypothetical protein